MSHLEIISAFQVRHILAPLIPEGTVDVGMPSRKAKELLEQSSFDYGVVRNGGKIVGLVARADLEDGDNSLPPGPPVKSLELKYLIPEATPISDSIRHLVEFPFQLVVSGKNVVGVVDDSDLNKHPVLAYLYCLLSRLEANLAGLASSHFPRTEDWCKILSPKRWEQIAARWREACKNQRQLDPLFYACFADFIEIIAASPELLTDLEFKTKTAWLGYVGAMNDLRNDVMHPVRDLSGPHRPVSKLAEIEERLKNLVERTDNIISKHSPEQAVQP